MTIAWNAFTPWSSLAGGILIGMAASLLILFNGKIAGISGILGGLFRPIAGDIGWRLAFIGGLLFAPLIYRCFSSWPPVLINTSDSLLILAGLIVGIGTRYGSGCTSGHGVCGISRLSGRSMVATLLFMAAGFAMQYVAAHLLAA